ncbi:MAG: hypothetical protein L7U72_15085 [Rubripirellula sp.]|nr:hypothetical protein [Rubripirellula sp.]
MGKKTSLKAKLKAADRRRKRRPSGLGAHVSPGTHEQSGIDAGMLAESTPQPFQNQSVASSDNSSKTSSPTDQAINLVADTIVRYANQRSRLANDALVISTLKGLLRGSSAASEESSELYQELEKIPTMPQMDRGSYRAAIETVLGIALQQENKTTPDAFLQYMQILSQ